MSVTFVGGKFVENCLRWFGHVQGRLQEAPVRRVEQIILSPIKRSKRRLNRILMEVIDRDLLIDNILKRLVNDRALWRCTIHIANLT